MGCPLFRGVYGLQTVLHTLNSGTLLTLAQFIGGRPVFPDVYKIIPQLDLFLALSQTTFLYRGNFELTGSRP